MTATEDLYESPYADLVTALGALTEAPRAGKVNAGQRQYTFMTLPDLLGQVRPVFAKHHLAVTQLVHNHDTGISVETRILHSSGHVFEYPPLTLRCAQDPQSIGSAITYGRRYQLAALVGLAGDDDDDGEHATRTAPKTAPPQRNQPAPPPPRPPQLDDRPAPPTRYSHQTGSTKAGSASQEQITFMWTLLGWVTADKPSARMYVAKVLSIDPGWSGNDLTQQQVSTVIDRLKAMPAVSERFKQRPAQGSDTTPPPDPE